MSTKAFVKAAVIGFADFGRSEHEELIVLSRSSDGFGADGKFGKQRRLVDYRFDRDDTRRYRAEMARINAFLAGADLEFVAEGRPLAVDTNRRRLVRYFNLPPWQEDDTPRFDLGGRLFSAWWENLPREFRRKIRIDGEPVADLDFASLFPRLAFLKLGIEPPPGDLYAGIPGLEDAKYRDSVKASLNTFIFATGPRARLPSEFKKQLPRGWTAQRMREAIVAQHPSLEPALEVAWGAESVLHRVANNDSDPASADR